MNWFDNNVSLISPKERPYDYFKKHETFDGIDCIRIYYRDYNPSGPMRYNRYVEIRTDLVRGMKKGFYLRGFDYALVVGEKVLCLEYAYQGKNGREFGCFAEGYKSKNYSEIDEKDSIWVL
jgi:hypothetical protein